jgi:hypothetical protein
MVETCKNLKTQPVGEMSGSDEASGSTDTRAFCDFTAADLSGFEAAMGGADYDAATVCDINGVMLDYICNGMCADACTTSKLMAGMSSSDESTEGEDVLIMSELCADPCFLIMGEKLSAFEKKESQCKAEGKTGGSGSDDSEGGGDSEGGDGSGGDDAEGGDDAGGGSGNSENQVEEIFTLGCTTNNNGENCIDKMVSLETARVKDDDDLILSSYSCSSSQMQDLLSLGCCFGTFLQTNAWMNVTDEDAAEMNDIASYLAECPGGEAALRPCTANTLKDVTIVKSEITFTDLDLKGLSSEEQKATKAAITQGIASDLNVEPRQVVITKMTTTTTRRRLGTNTQIEYQITLNPDSSTDSLVESKISNGDVTAATLISAGDTSTTPSLSAMTASQVAPSTAVTSETLVAEPPTSSSNGGSGMSTGAIVAIVVGALAAVAAITVGTLMFMTKSRQAQAPAQGQAMQVQGQVMQVQGQVVQGQVMSNPASTL